MGRRGQNVRFKGQHTQWDDQEQAATNALPEASTECGKHGTAVCQQRPAAKPQETQGGAVSACHGTTRSVIAAPHQYMTVVQKMGSRRRTIFTSSTC